MARVDFYRLTRDPVERVLPAIATRILGAGDHRLLIDKASPANTASQVFQSGASGRAEIGLAGDDDLHLKVSPDGVN